MEPSLNTYKATGTANNTVLPQAVSTRCPREDDASTLQNDDQEADLNAVAMEKKTAHSANSRINSRISMIVFEAWEVISVRPTIELTAFKRILGMKFVSSYKTMKDGYTGVRAMPSYSQVELAHMVATAEDDWTARYCGLGRFVNSDTYGQDLAKRIFELPGCLPSKLGALLDCRYVATNRNPHVRREWKIVLLEPIANALTDDGQQPCNHGSRKKGCSEQKYPVQKWLVVLRGRDARVSERAFQAFNTMSNPWFKVDERPHSGIGNTTEQHKESGGQQ
ncbi:hypothetical protein F5B22DRAFT_374645 [Xylaria bambusicola]|uniref:uncharacterized protein n=1 Tax=Xylaria bambusicola TaxID=326684 RepID=UPI002007A569|nr:uncharacterized protein F5B22DRAFT_374645 [Xylaria bambusicola]KAI0508945.1 hypothetical protein F5B22DRAFT_374645 [Xylaria bambusicola]